MHVNEEDHVYLLLEKNLSEAGFKRDRLSMIIRMPEYNNSNNKARIINFLHQMIITQSCWLTGCC